MGFPLSIIYDLPWQANTWKLFAASAEERISSTKKTPHQNPTKTKQKNPNKNQAMQQCNHVFTKKNSKCLMFKIWNCSLINGHYG